MGRIGRARDFSRRRKCSISEMEEVTKTASRVPRWVSHFFQYMVVGVISAVIDLTVFQVTREFLLFDYMLAKICSFAVGTIVNFFICIGFVFKIRGRSFVTATWRKLVSGAAALAVSLIVLTTLVEGLNFGEIQNLPLIPFDGVFLANAFAICIGFLLNFVLTKYYAFGDY